MTRSSPAHVSDDEVVSLARRYRREAIASLVTVLRDESAPASARAQASAKLLEYSDGKPGQAKQLTVADIGQMSPDLRQELLRALLLHYQVELPVQFQQMISAAVDEAVALARLTLAQPNRFKRGPQAGAGPHVPRWPPASPVKGISHEQQAELEGEAPAAAAPTTFGVKSAEKRATGEPCSMNVHGAPDNVVTLPGTVRPTVLQNCKTDRPAPFGIKYLNDPDAHAPSNGHGIHPDVVTRSTLRNPLDPFDPWRRS